jgi:predicted ATPase
MIKTLRFNKFLSEEYPFNIPCIKQIETLDLSNKITLFVGDNGSGKSTLLKAIAYYNNSINVSSQDIDSSYYKEVKELAGMMKCTYDVKTKKGFFFSGEEFITYINQLKQMKQDLKEDLKRVNEEYKNKSIFAQNQARMAYAGQLHAMEHAYDGDLKEKSHGEGFLEFFKQRMHQQGIYLLDEPETPLSAVNQYKLVVMITDLVRSGSQVIIATHSPIIMALENAKIYNFTEEKIEEVAYDDIESVVFTKHFLNHKENYINRL